ncbi:pyrroloquinoline quinone-dependent dehydrogenase [Sphingomonas sp. 2R-10]|uniref:pyrroloquinoline quinone-dependent dehydrogenase n=1 Tax=Sphingomonas sp. 2R-10 TaxID=3045148 RepID=UPI000F7B072F|nr:pyrroloquinoline quinone-dependent dehydrogenase [Sphingomonas sp. 2R-10]MDJ0276428.1 pyrroloquinoline quinone-dependent dehydrogenase [Sphingomonas sp. 2R-10]
MTARTNGSNGLARVLPLSITGLSIAGLALAAASSCTPYPQPTDRDWRTYGGDPAGQRYSTLTQINRDNVAQLTEVWRFAAGDEGGVQTHPLVVGTTLYGYTSDQTAFALDAATGRELWRFAPGQTSGQAARGMTYWASARDERLFVSNASFIYALDPGSGEPVAGFGDGGRIDLREGLGRDPEQNAVFPTSPGTLFRDTLIVGFRTAENAPAAPGDIRAYDVRTGRLKWSFHTIPHDREVGHETWPAGAARTAGGANAWAGLAVDTRRGIVYVPTGSPVFDFFGSNRKGDNLYSDSLVALDAATGKRLWHFQAVHHDLWDRDFPSPPTLLTVTRGGRRIDAVAQTTKQGFVFVFDRVTGKPLFPIEERPVPAGDVPGETTSPTQPFPIAPAPFARQQLTEAMLTRRTPAAHADALARFRTMRSAGQFVPLSTDRDTIVFPGFDGGAEWGGSAADPRTGVLYVNSNDVPWYTRLVPNTVARDAGPGERAYRANCSSCHGADRGGSPPDVPDLTMVGSRLTAAAIAATIVQGRGRMPGFPQIAAADRAALVAWLASGGKAPVGDRREVTSTGGTAVREPYAISGYNKFQDIDGYPAVRPPWGTLNAIDLNTGRYLWKVPLGEYPELAARGMRNTGSENYGGPIATAGGIVFIGATIHDRKLRAFDSRTGRLLWTGDLPFAGNATPVTYSVAGRQYVVIATSGARDKKGPQGAAYIAFALPDRRGGRTAAAPAARARGQ